MGWLIDRLSRQKIHSVTRLVRKLDDALNNTSLILLMEVGGLRMLFPGDAQIENWQDDGDEHLAATVRLLELGKVGPGNPLKP